MTKMKLKGSVADEIINELTESGYECDIDFSVIIETGKPIMVKYKGRSKIFKFYVKITLDCCYRIYNLEAEEKGKFKTVSEFIKTCR